MNKDRSVTLVLWVIAILLGANLFVWSLGNVRSSYADGNYQYKVVQTVLEDPQTVQIRLNQMSSEGWELVQLADSAGLAIFKK